MPYQKLVEILATHRLPGVTPLYQIGFNFVSLGFSRRSATAEDDLTLEICADQGRVEYNTRLFDERTAHTIADGYHAVLKAVLADPAVRMSNLPVDPAARPTGQPEVPVSGALPPLPAPDRYQAPRTAAEELVAKVWQEVLGVPKVGAHDEFFELGGHSLLALRVIARLSAAAGVQLSIQDFFVDTTVAGVAGHLERLLTADIDTLSEEEAQRLVAEGSGQRDDA
jgi:acyl carrier protein